MSMKIIETRRIVQRGKRGASTLLPKRFMEANELYHGAIMTFARPMRDITKLYLIVGDIGENSIKFTTEDTRAIKRYKLGIHVINSKYGSNTYPIITLPQQFIIGNGLLPGDQIDICETEQKNCLLITKTEQ